MQRRGNIGSRGSKQALPTGEHGGIGSSDGSALQQNLRRVAFVGG